MGRLGHAQWWPLRCGRCSCSVGSSCLVRPWHAPWPEQSPCQGGRAAGARQRPLYSFDMLGEGARTQTDAQAYFGAYQGAMQTLAQAQSAPVPPHLPTGQGATGRDGISIKLSALHPRYEDAQYERVMSELLPRVWSLCEQAAQAGMRLTIDAEESERLELSLRLLDALAQRVAQRCPQWDGLGLAVQAYQTRALACGARDRPGQAS